MPVKNNYLSYIIFLCHQLSDRYLTCLLIELIIYHVYMHTYGHGTNDVVLAEAAQGLVYRVVAVPYTEKAGLLLCICIALALR